MNKLKTRKSLLKRFKITATGKVLRGHQYSRHLRRKKQKKRIRFYKKTVELTAKQSRIVKSLIPN